MKLRRGHDTLCRIVALLLSLGGKAAVHIWKALKLEPPQKRDFPRARTGFLPDLTRVVDNAAYICLFVFVGFSLNSILHLYRFVRLNWISVTGLTGMEQPILISLIVSGWPVLPILFRRHFVQEYSNSGLDVARYSVLFILLNQTAGRSLLKATIDVFFCCLLLTWFLHKYVYSYGLESIRDERKLEYVASELLTLFEASLVILTFVISVFGFSFASDYFTQYFHDDDVAQATMWWYGIMSIYLAFGALFFVSFYEWVLVIRARETAPVGVNGRRPRVGRRRIVIRRNRS